MSDLRASPSFTPSAVVSFFCPPAVCPTIAMRSTSFLLSRYASTILRCASLISASFLPFTTAAIADRPFFPRDLFLAFSLEVARSHFFLLIVPPTPFAAFPAFLLMPSPAGIYYVITPPLGPSALSLLFIAPPTPFSFVLSTLAVRHAFCRYR